MAKTTKPQNLRELLDRALQEERANFMGYVFWCLHSQSWTYYDCVASGLTIFEDRINKEDNIRVKMNKEISDPKNLRLNLEKK